MKKFCAILFSFVLVLIIALPVAAEGESSTLADNAPSLTAPAAYVVNLDTNIVVYEKNSETPLSAASLTKLMTTLLLLENYQDQLDSISLTAPSYVYDLIWEQSTNASSADIRRGETQSLRNLLYAMLLPSGNEAAYIVADYMGGGSIGFTGLFSLGQAGFMLLGAYTYAILTIPAASQKSIYQRYANGGIGFSIPELLSKPLGGFGLLLGVVFCLILAGFIAALFAFLIGLPVLKLKSDYLAIATLGFAEIIRAAVVYEGFGPLTNGSNLLYGFTSFASFNLSPGGTTLHLETVMPFLFSGICIAIILLLINSTYGRAFKAIRDDEIAAEAMGINLASHKRMSFIISSFFAGISGAMLAMYQASVQATTFKSSMTYEILLIVVIGGIGSVSGSIIASFLFIASSEWLLRFLDNETWIGGFRVPLLRSGFRMVVFSIIIMAVVLFFRKGIMGDRELFQKKPASTAKAAKKEARSK